eukprot:COSAG01_NODE_1173_length_11400_cov_2.767366_8_plen_188_part_00
MLAAGRGRQNSGQAGLPQRQNGLSPRPAGASFTCTAHRQPAARPPARPPARPLARLRACLPAWVRGVLIGPRMAAVGAPCAESWLLAGMWRLAGTDTTPEPMRRTVGVLHRPPVCVSRDRGQGVQLRGRQRQQCDLTLTCLEAQTTIYVYILGYIYIYDLDNDGPDRFVLFPYIILCLHSYAVATAT